MDYAVFVVRLSDLQGDSVLAVLHPGLQQMAWHMTDLTSS